MLTVNTRPTPTARSDGGLDEDDEAQCKFSPHIARNGSLSADARRVQEARRHPKLENRRFVLTKSEMTCESRGYKQGQGNRLMPVELRRSRLPRFDITSIFVRFRSMSAEAASRYPPVEPLVSGLPLRSIGYCPRVRCSTNTERPISAPDSLPPVTLSGRVQNSNVRFGAP